MILVSETAVVLLPAAVIVTPPVQVSETAAMIMKPSAEAAAAVEIALLAILKIVTVDAPPKAGSQMDSVILPSNVKNSTGMTATVHPPENVCPAR